VIGFVHGVPETAAIWDGVRAALDRPSTALALPGFGCPHPDGFGATADEYVTWLVEQLDAVGEPVDLVGHDWGALLTVRVATRFGDRLRSWAVDIGNVVHADYVWHPFAQIWQQPGEGEAFTAAQRATPVADRAAALVATMGLSDADALELAAGEDELMDASILALYRSAVPNVHAAWGPWSPTAAPGLILHATADPFSDEALARASAAQLGARVELLADAGHFWPYQAPEAAAELLERFWTSLP
jgi:pimeloyl-ACP methyl ester carboxylesterase